MSGADAPPFNPFHTGEIEAQRLAGARASHAPLRSFMPEQHRVFYGQLSYVLLATLDETGAPQATMLDGAPGFLHSPTPTSLVVRPRPDKGDAVRRLLRPGAQVGLLGIELPTRRRNRANGSVVASLDDGWMIHVTQSFGNCPQYIHTREIEAKGAATHSESEFLDGLDMEARTLIAASDTLFVASAAAILDGGVDMSHRGGRAGFVEVRGGELAIPEFPGNNYYNTVGNFLIDPRAALLFVDFEHGTLLGLTGHVEIDWHPERSPSGARFVWRFRVKGGWRRHGALPYRWRLHDLSPTLAKTGPWPAP